MLLAWLCAAVATAGAAASSAIAPAARPAAAIVDEFHDALRRGDGRAALALMADDALVFESGHVEHDKAQYARLHLAADVEFARTVKEVTTARSGHAAAGLAVIASEGRSSGRFGGKAVDRATTETMVLRRAQRQWRIVHVHWSSARR